MRILLSRCEWSALVAVAVLFCTSSTPAFEDEPTLSERLQRFEELENASEVADFYRALFQDLNADDLGRLVHHENDSLATQAAWETVNASVQIEASGNSFRPKRQKLAWFLGFLEGRARIAVPQWWKEGVLSDGRASWYYENPQDSPYHPLPYGRPNCPRDATVADIDGVLTYRHGDDSIVVPKGLLRRYSDGSLEDNISCCFTSERCFVYAPSDVGYPRVVACIDRANDHILWTSEVCGCWWYGSTGIHISYATVVATEDDRMFVFGMASTGFYVHGFRATDGETLFQFSNNY